MNLFEFENKKKRTCLDKALLRTNRQQDNRRMKFISSEKGMLQQLICRGRLTRPTLQALIALLSNLKK